MKNTVLLTIIFLAGVLSSCQKMLIGNPAPNTPVANFDALWQGYSDWYGLFGVNNVNWDSLYQVSRPSIHNEMTNEELYQSLCALIKPLNDIHVFLQPTSGGLPRYESSVFFRTHKVQEDFSLSLLRQKYLTGMVSIDTNLQYGFLPGNLGYLHFGEFGMPRSFYQQKLPAILEQLKDTRGLIIDIRNHGGGDDEVSRYIAGLFASSKQLFMTVRKRNGTGRMQFTAPQEWYVEPAAKGGYVKPIVLLTTRWTASAGETFTWAMNTQAHVQQMGDTTAGGFSDVISWELPNGWLYFVPVGDYRNADGKSEEGRGVAPKIVLVNTKEDIQSGLDKVLEAAIQSF